MIELSHEEIRALRAALDDTRRAWATYDRVIRGFGPVQPFPTVRDAEACHIKALKSLFLRYGLPLPRTRSSKSVPRFANLAEAFAASIEAETRRATELFKQLRAATTQPDILAELRNLERASRDGHLPALRACAQELRLD